MNEGGNVVSPTHRPPLPPEIIPGTHFCRRLRWPQGQSAAGRIVSLKNSNDTIGNRPRDLPVCSSVPQPLRHRVPYRRIVLDELVDNNLRDMHGTGNIVQSIKLFSHVISPLKPELNPYAQHCPTRIFTGDFISWTLHFVNICVKKPKNATIIHSDY
jgi:hypothetical protein